MIIILNIDNLIESEQYSFLKSNKLLKDNIMVLSLAGSYSYGTNIDSSDVDIRGIFAENINSLLGLSNVNNFKDSNTDTLLYSFKRSINLLLNSNPGMIELFGVKPEHCLILSEEGKILKDNIDLFLSSNVFKSFGGYFYNCLKQSNNKSNMNGFKALFTGTDILKGKGIITYREKERDFLLDIRNGKYSNEDILELYDIYNEEFRYAYNNTSLSKEIEYDKIEELTIYISQLPTTKVVGL